MDKMAEVLKAVDEWPARRCDDQPDLNAATISLSRKQLVSMKKAVAGAKEDAKSDRRFFCPVA